MQNEDIPYITTGQMREVDRLMVEEYGIMLVQMMENAGRALADLARRRFLNGNPPDKHVAILAGAGGNGGGGLVAARRLAGWGVQVSIHAAKPPPAYQGAPARQLAIVDAMGLPIYGDRSPALSDADLIIDALIGYNLSGAPKGRAATLIRAANGVEVPVLSLDMPSGVEATGGVVLDPAICAAATMTLALPKRGLCHDAAVPAVGELYLADIGVPPVLYHALGLRSQVDTLFARSDLFRLC